MGSTHSNIESVIADLAAGRLCILTDDKDREDEGDLIACASTITPEQINFMARYGRGLICLAMSAGEVDRLGLPPMTPDNQCPHETAFTVSIDAREGVSTGISAFDRAHTVRLAADPSSTLADFRVPGHIFPLRARPGVLLEREGHTEASVELCRLAGRGESTVICEIMDDDGHMMRGVYDLILRHSLALGNGILTVENEQQAIERADPARKNKGGDAASAALHMLGIKKKYTT